MGTETNDFLHISAWLLNCVKLNNPLMGTETILHHMEYITILALDVKLNNPLMGTETPPLGYNHMQMLYHQVKLNNPLMGTETIRPP